MTTPYTALAEVTRVWLAASRTYLNDRTGANCAALLAAFAAYQALTTHLLED